MQHTQGQAVIGLPRWQDGLKPPASNQVGNIGTERRLELGVIGDTVNVAARVEQLNKELGTETLVTEETLIRLPDAQRRTAVPRGEHKVKGRDRSVVVYSLQP